MRKIPSSELIINSDGSIFHLHIKPEELAHKVILVGDPGRVETVAAFFDEKLFGDENREFKWVTGIYQQKRITVLSTGIGTDNIDIVMNELDALVNIDFETRTVKEKQTALEIVRIGTSGGMQAEAEVDHFVLSERSVGFDGVLNYYEGRDSVCDLEFEQAFKAHTSLSDKLSSPYVVASAKELVDKLSSSQVLNGITISSPGFYGPQGRVLRLNVIDAAINEKITSFSHNGSKITNYEMESSAIAGLAALLGHQATTLCVIIANRVNKTFSKDYKPAVKSLIQYVLERI